MARPTPVPSKSSLRCIRWKTPKSLLAYSMSKPAPLSRTKYVGPSTGVVFQDTNFNPRVLPPAGVFEGVAQQVDEDLLEEGGVARGVWQLADHHLDLPAVECRRQLLQGLIDNPPE